MTDNKKKRAPDITDDEARRIETGIDQDPDTQLWTKKEFDEAHPAREMEPEILKAYEQGKLKTRGPQKAPTKKQITLRLDQDVIEHFKQGGKGWQSRLNDYLRNTLREKL